MANEAGHIRIKRTLHKILLVGEKHSGKRTLSYRFAQGKMPELTRHTMYGWTDNVSIHVGVNEVTVNLFPLLEPGCFGLGDTTSQRDQWLYYPETSAFLICFSIAKRDSFEQVKDRWGPELGYILGRQEDFREDRLAQTIKKSCSGMGKVPILLVGCQKDLRAENRGERDETVSSSEGEVLAREIGAAGYFECSSTTGEGVNEVFKEAARLAIEAEHGKSKGSKLKRWIYSIFRTRRI